MTYEREIINCQAPMHCYNDNIRTISFNGNSAIDRPDITLPFPSFTKHFFNSSYLVAVRFSVTMILLPFNKRLDMKTSFLESYPSLNLTIIGRGPFLWAVAAFGSLVTFHFPKR